MTHLFLQRNPLYLPGLLFVKCQFEWLFMIYALKGAQRASQAIVNIMFCDLVSQHVVVYIVEQ